MTSALEAGQALRRRMASAPTTERPPRKTNGEAPQSPARPSPPTREPLDRFPLALLGVAASDDAGKVFFFEVPFGTHALEDMTACGPGPTRGTLVA